MIPLSDDNTTRHAPVASRTILVACCLIYLWQVFQFPWGQMAIRALGFTPAFFFTGGTEDRAIAWVPFSVPLISYMFLHGSWPHLLGNMLFLWIFGDDVEDALGHPGFIGFYLLTGMLAAMAQAWPNPYSDTTIVGASGAISGVLGAFLVLYPRAQIRVLVLKFFVVDVVPLPAWVVLVFWFLVQVLYQLYSPAMAGGIAFRAHIGGFIAGMILAPVFLLVSGRRRADLSAKPVG